MIVIELLHRSDPLIRDVRRPPEEPANDDDHPIEELLLPLLQLLQLFSLVHHLRLRFVYRFLFDLFLLLQQVFCKARLQAHALRGILLQVMEGGAHKEYEDEVVHRNEEKGPVAVVMHHLFETALGVAEHDQ